MKKIIRAVVATILISQALCCQLDNYTTLAAEPTAGSNSGVIELGSQRELFVDHHMIEKMNDTELVLHRPHDEGIALEFDYPWEGPFCGYVTMIQDGSRYLAYYRGHPKAAADGSVSETTCVAVSADGIKWTKPRLGLFEADGSKENNIILADHAPFSHNFCPMLDRRPGVPADERFKALAGTRKTGLNSFASADGFTWRRTSDKGVITEGAFDSQNVPFYSESEKQYICYFRVFVDKKRRISRTTSPDFVTWSKPVLMEYDQKPIEHLYTNQTSPYFRAPQIYIGIAARFFPGRRVLSEAQAKQVGVHPRYFNDCSDGVLISTRGGNLYNRTFMEGFVRPGIGLENWVSRTNYPALNVIPTGDDTMSLFVNQNYGQPTAHLRRYSLRTDGFVSVHAPYSGGELTTRLFTFTGNELEINFATSAAGEIKVELQDAAGNPIPGFSLSQSTHNIGNEISRKVLWESDAKLSDLAGKSVRLRFQMKDADLYSFGFK